MKKYTCSEIRKAKGAIIVYPTMGTLDMQIKDVVKADDGKWYVEGLVWNETGYYQYNMPEDYHGEYEYMSFPISCIKSLDFN